MSLVQQSVDVDVSTDVARLEWARFSEWVLVGNSKLLCDVRICDIVTAHETVAFERLSHGGTRVHLRFLDEPESALDRSAKEQLVRARLAHDLARYKEYVETEVHGHHRHSRAEHKAIVDSEVRKGLELRVGESFVEADQSDSYGPPHYMA